MNFHIESEVAVRLVLSLIIGTIIGLEREYRSKDAGLRTIIMICLGSTVFTLISISILDASDDRIASNIVTGIGFLGAGVIFKDGLTVKGLTTASTIWISAALGMAIGVGEYFIAIVSSVIVMFVLAVLEKVTLLIARMHQVRSYKISIATTAEFEFAFTKELKRLKLNARQNHDFKKEDTFFLHYEIAGREKGLNELDEFLKKRSDVIRYEY